MTKTKKLSKLLLLIATMVILLAACGGNTKNSNSSQPNAEGAREVQPVNSGETNQGNPSKSGDEETKKNSKIGPDMRWKCLYRPKELFFMGRQQEICSLWV